jgi:hypothetical protein
MTINNNHWIGSFLVSVGFTAFSILGFNSCYAQQKEAKVTATAPAIISDSALLDLVQQQTIKYFTEGAEPISGMARERYHVDNDYPDNDKNIVTSGGSGFGVMAILVAMDRKFITREDGVQRLEKIVRFLETADRFHGAWPHWWNGETGKVKPFGKKDNGGDLVETSLIRKTKCTRFSMPLFNFPIQNLPSTAFLPSCPLKLP